MMARFVPLLLILPLLTFGDAEQDVTDVVSTLAGALGDDNPQLFLKNLDHGMAGYRQLEQDIVALAAENFISCTVEVISSNGTGSALTADLDWYMSLKSQQDENLIERRRTKVTIKIEKRGKKWVVTSFSPITIFAQMKAK
jgi:hypothetical protein